jgi:hypothetical protein
MNETARRFAARRKERGCLATEDRPTAPCVTRRVWDGRGRRRADLAQKRATNRRARLAPSIRRVRAPDTRAAAVFGDGKSGGHARRARFRAKERGCVTHSMNGAVETRSNWKGLNAGLREVPSMAAMSFAVVGEGEDVPDTRERALKSDRDESHPLRFVRVPSKRHCQRNDLRVAETWKAPQKLARK